MEYGLMANGQLSYHFAKYLRHSEKLKESIALSKKQ
jgi:hypothetical protein